MQDAGELWISLDAFGECHPPLQIAIRHSAALLPQHEAFAEALEALPAELRQRHAVLVAFTSRCHRLRFLWVLADLIQLYNWLHITFDQLLKEDKAKTMSIREMLDSMGNHGRFDAAEGRRINELWNRSKCASVVLVHPRPGSAPPLACRCAFLCTASDLLPAVFSGSASTSLCG